LFFNERPKPIAPDFRNFTVPVSITNLEKTICMEPEFRDATEVIKEGEDNGTAQRRLGDENDQAS
jgi:hypothetical protein